jgi:hypothetical protein
MKAPPDHDKKIMVAIFKVGETALMADHRIGAPGKAKSGVTNQVRTCSQPGETPCPSFA